MKLKFLRFFCSQIRAAIDTGKYQDISIAEVVEKIRKGDLIDYLVDKIGEDADLSIFREYPELNNDLHEKLQSFSEIDPRRITEWTGRNNGLWFLEVLTTEIAQRLENEYKELCQDWRLRDKYVLDKLGATGILFALLGYAMASIPANEYPIRLLLGFIGTFFSFVLCVSIFKDIYYRDSTERLLIYLSDYLGVKDSLHTLGCQQEFKNNLEFPRKIKCELEEIMKKSILTEFKCVLSDLSTFNLVICFYFSLFFIFLALTLRILLEWEPMSFFIAVGFLIVLIFFVIRGHVKTRKIRKKKRRHDS